MANKKDFFDHADDAMRSAVDKADDAMRSAFDKVDNFFNSIFGGASSSSKDENKDNDYECTCHKKR